MNDILGQLKEMSNVSCLQLVSIEEGAKLPDRVSTKRPLYVLYALKDYCLKTGPLVVSPDRSVEIDTGIAIDLAQNVDIVAFAPRNRCFYESMFMKEPEIFIDADYRGEISFIAEELYQSEFLDPGNDDTIWIQKGDPICYLKVTPTNNSALHVSVKERSDA